METQAFIDKIKDYYPEFMENGQFKILNKGKFDLKDTLPANFEKILFNVTHGRSLRYMNYSKIYSEAYVNTVINSDQVYDKLYIDYGIKDLKGSFITLVENGFVPDTTQSNLVKKDAEKKAQIFEYLYQIISLEQKSPNVILLAEEFIININLYNKEVFLSNENNYEIYMDSGHNHFKSTEIFKNTGLYSTSYKINKKELIEIFESEKSNTINASSFKDKRSAFFKYSFEDEYKYSNFIMYYTNKAEVLKIQNHNFLLVFNKEEETERDFLEMKKIPYRSQQRGGSSHDNVRGEDLSKVHGRTSDIIQNVFSVFKNNTNNFEKEIPVILKNEICNLGWENRKISGSIDSSIFQYHNGETLVLSLDMSMNNGQHSSKALCNIKEELLDSKDPGIYLKQYIDSPSLNDLIDSNFSIGEKIKKFILSLNPNLEFTFWNSAENASHHSTVNNNISEQSKVEQQIYDNSLKLKKIATKCNQILSLNKSTELNKGYFFYSGASHIQDSKNVIKKIKTIEVHDLMYLISAYKSTSESSIINEIDLIDEYIQIPDSDLELAQLHLDNEEKIVYFNTFIKNKYDIMDNYFNYNWDPIQGKKKPYKTLNKNEKDILLNDYKKLAINSIIFTSGLKDTTINKYGYLWDFCGKNSQIDISLRTLSNEMEKILAVDWGSENISFVQLKNSSQISFIKFQDTIEKILELKLNDSFKEVVKQINFLSVNLDNQMDITINNLRKIHTYIIESNERYDEENLKNVLEIYFYTNSDKIFGRVKKIFFQNKKENSELIKKRIEVISRTLLRYMGSGPVKLRIPFDYSSYKKCLDIVLNNFETLLNVNGRYSPIEYSNCKHIHAKDNLTQDQIKLVDTFFKGLEDVRKINNSNNCGVQALMIL